MPTVVLLRHGETAWNREGRLQGWAPTGLTDRGHEQARTVAEHLDARHVVDRLVVSDLRRTRETATPIARRLDLDPTFDARWRERDFGRLQGLSKADASDHPGYALPDEWRDTTPRPESGESIADARSRVLGAWEALCDALDADETAVVVTHGGPIRAVVGSVRGLSLDEVAALSVGNCSRTEVRLGDGSHRVLRVGESTPPSPPE